MTYILEVQEDENGDQYIVFPDEVTEELGWEEGDILNWDVRGTGIVISKVNDAAGYEVIEEQNKRIDSQINAYYRRYSSRRKFRLRCRW